MHQYKDKKKNILFIFLILIFLSSINNQPFIKKKEKLYDLKYIEVIGLDKATNLDIEENLNFLKNTNIFFIDKEILKDQLSKYNFIENYNIFKLYPSKIILELEQTEFLARTIKNNEIYLLGSNSKLINIEKFSDFENLPIVFGKFTPYKFINFKKIIDQSDLDFNSIKEIFFFPSGRIDIKNKDNILIKFPLHKIEETLDVANKIINSNNLINNIIDLRIPNQLILSNE
ncbi:FtsQ-type POTRA domain-containing protein [Candidatus Pelagibacter sp.]|nr:FtsQ-type POTRA domain-containing protein [Candidatus Pelagibacter sp.]|tara:strand:+ start:666 stop:1355 length:690 start_codon:yes stop_codon:yes gene_type:complete